MALINLTWALTCTSSMAQESYLRADLGLLSLFWSYVVGVFLWSSSGPTSWMDLGPQSQWVPPPSVPVDGPWTSLSMSGIAFEPCCQQLALPAVFRCSRTTPVGEDTAYVGVTLSSWLSFPYRAAGPCWSPTIGPCLVSTSDARELFLKSRLHSLAGKPAQQCYFWCTYKSTS